MSKVYIGIDGGGTKTAFAIVDQEGKLLARELGTTIHIKQASPENLKELIHTKVRAMIKEIGKTKEDIGHLFAGVPAYGEFSEIIDVFDPIFEELVGPGKFTYRNDAVAGWAGSQAGKPGVNMVLGTGSIAFGMDYKGNEARSSGWGMYCGDQGSGYWLGRQAINLFGKQSDGRSERGPLYRIVKEQFDLEDDVDFISIILDMNDNRTEIAKLSKIISQAANEGDKDALEVLKETSQEVIDCMHAVIDKLDFEEDEKIYISYSGGVFNIGELVTDPIEEVMLQDPRIEKLDSILDPTAGACLMALRFGGVEITDQIVKNLKNM